MIRLELNNGHGKDRWRDNPPEHKDEQYEIKTELNKCEYEVYNGDEWKSYMEDEQLYLKKLETLIANRDNIDWWKQWDVMIYSPSIMVGLDFRTSIEKRKQKEEDTNKAFWIPHFKTIFCYMVSEILDVFQTVQMVRRFRDIREYNMCIPSDRQGGIHPIQMRETDSISEMDIALLLKMDHNDYFPLDESMKTMLKNSLVSRIASMANYREIVFYLMERQGITKIEATPVDEDDLVEEGEEEIKEYIIMEDKAEEDKVNRSITNLRGDILKIQHYHKTGLLHKNTSQSATFALYLMITVCNVDRDKLKVGDKFNLDMIQAQKLSKYKYDTLAEKVCCILYGNNKEVMDNRTVKDIIDAFKRSVCYTKVWGKDVNGKDERKKFVANNNYHLYKQLGLYSLTGMRYIETSKFRYIVNGEKKRVKVPRLQYEWKL